MLVLILHQTPWKENASRYIQLRALQTAVTVEKIFSDQFASRSLSLPLLGLPSLQTNQCCSTQEHFHSAVFRQAEICWTGLRQPSSVWRKCLRDDVQNHPTTSARGRSSCKWKALFLTAPDLEKYLCPQHQAFYRLMIDALHGINCSNDH